MNEEDIRTRFMKIFFNDDKLGDKKVSIEKKRMTLRKHHNNNNNNNRDNSKNRLKSADKKDSVWFLLGAYQRLDFNL